MLRGPPLGELNLEGRTPLEMTDDIQTESLRRDAKRMLGPPGALDCLMLSTPTRKTIKSPRTLIVFIVMYVIVMFCEVLAVFPHMPLWVVYLMLATVLYNVLMLTITVCMNPGYLENSNVDFLYMLEVADPTHLCPDCLVVRTSRSKHCSVC